MSLPLQAVSSKLSTIDDIEVLIAEVVSNHFHVVKLLEAETSCFPTSVWVKTLWWMHMNHQIFIFSSGFHS